MDDNYDLTDKLMKVLEDKKHDDYVKVTQIKQAFADEGYIQPGKTLYKMPKGKDLARELAGLDQLVDDSTTTLELTLTLTGQEWYDRFWHEIVKGGDPEYITSNITGNGKLFYDDKRILEAAKKASGL